MPNKERNHTIDLLRLIASSWVVLFHLNEPIPWVDNFYSDIYKMGALGVPIFFVVSGYCIALAAQNSKSSFDFLTRRLFRIFPMYWFSLLVVIICVIIYIVFFGQNSVTVLPHSIKDVSATLTLLTDPFSSIPTTNWVYWSLTVEIFFYLVVGITLLFNRTIQQFLLLTVSLLVFLPDLYTVRGFFFLKDWPVFGLGFALFSLHDKSKQDYFSWLLLMVNFFALYSLHRFDAYTITSLVAFVLIAASLFWADLGSNFFSRLGDYAYSVYLIHVPLGVYLLNHFKTPTVQKNVFFQSAYDIIVLIILLFISSLTFRFIELPGIQFGKKVAKKLNKKHSSLITVQA
jgi:peptidoglycan/LPS O-acetylase OafA/YrhL